MMRIIIAIVVHFILNGKGTKIKKISLRVNHYVVFSCTFLMVRVAAQWNSSCNSYLGKSIPEFTSREEEKV
jgi:RsiW-degrading membrane proteinase PrsW (M82 family)